MPNPDPSRPRPTTLDEADKSTMTAAELNDLFATLAVPSWRVVGH